MGPSRWLPFYGDHFDTVEINASFYRLPKTETFSAWKEATPPDFLFAVKASRYLTHMRRLRDPEDPLRRILESAQALEEKLGPILFQLPPNWPADLERLAGFLRLLPKDRRFVFEFRHPSWFSGETFSLLERHDAALCIASSPSYPLIEKVTAPFVFIRMHGGRVLYGSRYLPEELSEWAKKIERFVSKGLDCYVYFNNDAFAFAIENARQLREILDSLAKRRAAG